MSKAFQRSFAAGEVTPAVYGNAGLSKYQTGLRVMKNFFTARHGGAYNRAGTSFLLEQFDMTKRVRLIPFIDSGRVYILEMGDEYIRILKDDEPIAVTSKDIAAISKGATTTVSLKKYSPFKVGDVVTFASVAGMTQINGLTGTITSVNGVGSFVVNINSSAFSNATANTGTVTLVTPRNVELESPYTEDVLREVTVAMEAGIMTFAHQSAMPQELRRYSDQSWTLLPMVNGPAISAPTGLAVSGTGGTSFYWAITAISDTFEESALTAEVGANSVPSQVSPRTLTWNSVAGATGYNVYGGNLSGNLGFIGVSYTNQFVDGGAAPPDYDSPPPLEREPIFEGLPGMSNFPAAVGHAQQRRLFGNIGPRNEQDGPPTIIQPGWDPKPDRVLASRIGSPSNFNASRPSLDDDALIFRLLARESQEIRHFLTLGKKPAVFTGQAEWILEGSQDGVLTPARPNPQEASGYGSGFVAPLPVDGGALFVQAQSSAVRSFGFEFEVENYRGNELSVFSAHLIDGKEIVESAFQKTPHPIAWFLRDDGVLLGMTYVREQQVYAWHRHEFRDGEVESICCVPEEGEHKLYLAIKREVDGSTVRYIEKMSSRTVSDIVDAIFVDSAITYDGRNTNDAHTMTLTGGTDWDSEDELTLESSTNFFAQEDEDNENAIHLRGPNDELIRFRITNYVSPTEVTGFAHKDVPESMQDVALSTWTKAIRVLTGLDHLEGKQLSVLGDGFVVANALRGEEGDDGSTYTEVVVDGGEAELERAYGVIHAGLPILAELETLDLDAANGETLVGNSKLINKLTIWVEGTRGLWAGGARPDDDDEDPIEGFVTGLDEIKLREDEDYDDPVALKTKPIELTLTGHWSKHGRTIIRQIDPLPAAVLSIAPEGLIVRGA